MCFCNSYKSAGINKRRNGGPKATSIFASRQILWTSLWTKSEALEKEKGRHFREPPRMQTKCSVPTYQCAAILRRRPTAEIPAKAIPIKQTEEVASGTEEEVTWNEAVNSPELSP